jgi:hypothetical protein
MIMGTNLCNLRCTSSSKTAAKTLQYMIKYAILSNKSFKKIRSCMPPKAKELQKLEERDHRSKDSICICVFTILNGHMDISDMFH